MVAELICLTVGVLVGITSSAIYVVATKRKLVITLSDLKDGSYWVTDRHGFYIPISQTGKSEFVMVRVPHPLPADNFRLREGKIVYESEQ